MLRHLAIFAGLVVVACTVAPTSSAGRPPTDQDDLRAKVRNLEERLARLEKRLTAGTETVPFGDVVVNLKDERMARYLRVKITLKVDEANTLDATRLVTTKKAELKCCLITYLADLSLKDVGGSQNIERMREVMKREFNRVLAPGAKTPIVKDVLFEEYVVQ